MSTTVTTSSLIADARYEVVPLKSVEAQLPHLPAGASVSVTCSPTKGLPATLDLTARLLDLGHSAIPHFSARLVHDRDEVRRLAAFCASHGVREMFLVAGDPPDPVGDYDGALAFLRDFLACDHGLQRIGVTAYPDGHAFIPPDVVRQALLAKQALLAEAGVAGFATTQMCFDIGKWRSWATTARAEGLALPLHAGVPGVIDRMKLLTMGLRLGVGASMRYVRKNGGILGRLLAPAAYDPSRLVTPLGKLADELGIEGLHLFTFNNVQATAEWQRSTLAKLP
jgi:methylenetetrahydrofolate reductase (NADPH)